MITLWVPGSIPRPQDETTGLDHKRCCTNRLPDHPRRQTQPSPQPRFKGVLYQLCPPSGFPGEGQLGDTPSGVGWWTLAGTPVLGWYYPSYLRQDFQGELGESGERSVGRVCWVQVALEVRCLIPTETALELEVRPHLPSELGGLPLTSK